MTVKQALVSAATLLLAGQVMAGIVLAKDDATTSPQPSLKQERQEIPEKKADIKNKRAEVKERVATNQAERRAESIDKFKRQFTNIIDRTGAAIERLSNLINRIESRIAKMKEKGIDTSAAEAKLTTAKEVKKQAEAKVATAKAKITAIDSASDKKVAVKEAVAATREAKQALQQVHKALKDVVSALRASEKEATSSSRKGTNSGRQ